MPEVTAIDLNRGITKRFAPGGIAVCMYKDDPGRYYSASGHPLGEDVARSAGFPVDDLRRKRQMIALQREALTEIERKFMDVPTETLAEFEGWELRHEGVGRHSIYDPTGSRVTRQHMTREEAQIMFEQITGTKIKLPEREPAPEVRPEVEARDPEAPERVQFVPPFHAQSKGFGNFCVVDDTGRKAFPEDGWLSKEEATAKAEELNVGV